MPRYARRTDDNLQEIADVYKLMGCEVHFTNGDWDLTIDYKGIIALVEVKDGMKPESRTRVREGNQEKVHEKLNIMVIKFVDQAISHVKILRRQYQLRKGEIHA